jgi:hypothetical protein
MSKDLLSTYNRSLNTFEKKGEKLPKGPKRDIVLAFIDEIRKVIIFTDIELQYRSPNDDMISNVLDRIEINLDQIRHTLHY